MIVIADIAVECLQLLDRLDIFELRDAFLELAAGHGGLLRSCGRRRLRPDAPADWMPTSQIRRKGRAKQPPSRPGEFPPEPLTEPDVSLSTYPARATHRRL